jgi:hypothetical protein
MRIRLIFAAFILTGLVLAKKIGMPEPFLEKKPSEGSLREVIEPRGPCSFAITP